MFKFMAKVFSDEKGPSSQRVFLGIILLFTVITITAAQYKAKDWAIPVLPASFVDLVEWLISAFCLGVFAPKVVNAVQAIKVPETKPEG